jgi:hypothetical protein
MGNGVVDSWSSGCRSCVWMSRRPIVEISSVLPFRALNFTKMSICASFAPHLGICSQSVTVQSSHYVRTTLRYIEVQI